MSKGYINNKKKIPKHIRRGIKWTSNSHPFLQIKKPLSFLQNASMFPEKNDASEVIETQSRIFKVQHLEMKKGREKKKSIINIIQIHSVTLWDSPECNERNLSTKPPVFTSPRELDKN